MLYCPKCGRENPEGSRFCSACGAPLTAEPSPFNQSNTGGEGLSGEMQALVFLGNFCLTPAVGLILYLVWSNKEPKKASEACSLTWWALGVGVALGLMFAILNG